MTSRCKRRPSIDRLATGSDGALVSLSVDTVEYTMRVVDVANAGVPWSYAYEQADRPRFNLAAGEALSEEHLVLEADLALWVFAAAGSTVEIVTWRA